MTTDTSLTVSNPATLADIWSGSARGRGSRPLTCNRALADYTGHGMILSSSATSTSTSCVGCSRPDLRGKTMLCYLICPEDVPTIDLGAPGTIPLLLRSLTRGIGGESSFN